MYLSIDTSSDTLSVALTDARDQGLTLNSRSSYKHSDYLVPFIEMLFKLRKVTWNDIQGIILGSGPGSFTGLRIGFSCVKGFMLALNKPVWTLSSFYAVFYKYKDQYSRILYLKNAMKGNVYLGTFRLAGENIRASIQLIGLKDFLKTIGSKKDFLFTGESFRFRRDILKRAPRALILPADDSPDAALLARAALELFPRKKLTRPGQLKPLYFYPETCQIQRK